MGTSRLTRAESKERTFESLLCAAQRIFIDRGYQGATLDAVAAEAGFTKGAVYAHFDSKEQLLCMLFERALGSDAKRLELLLDQGKHNREMLVRQLADYVDFVEERDGLVMLALELHIEARNNPRIADHVRNAMEAHQRRIETVIDRYFAAVGSSPPLPASQLAPTIVNLVIGFVLARKAGRTNTPGAAPMIRALLGLPLDAKRAKSDPFG